MPEYDVLISTSDENNPDYIKVVNDEGKTLVNHTFITKVGLLNNLYARKILFAFSL